jgi:sulfate transport system ATP-binding protein
MIVMNAGRIEQIGSPTEVCEAPATPFVREFLGDVALPRTQAATLVRLPAKILAPEASGRVAL